MKYLMGGIGLCKIKWGIMELLWNAEIPLSYAEITESLKGRWRTKKIHICLVELENAGFIEIKANRGFYAICKKDDFIDCWGKEQIKNYLKVPQFTVGNFRMIKKIVRRGCRRT